MRERKDTLKEQLITRLQRVDYWMEQMGEQPVEWRIRNMRTQWGNCRPQRRLITFNLQLANVPDNLLDYIIVHELAHLKHPNHSPAFKQHMATYIPDWKQRQEQLKQYEKQIQMQIPPRASNKTRIVKNHSIFSRWPFSLFNITFSLLLIIWGSSCTSTQ